MPIYEYQCADCRERDLRAVIRDDQAVLCTRCGGLMLRLAEDVLQPYIEEIPLLPAAFSMAKASP